MQQEVLKELELEQSILSNTVSVISEQITAAHNKLNLENSRAQELTQAIMHTQREEDKALLASDEAVSHGLRDQKKIETTTLAAQIKKPYFARIELEEEDIRTGKTRPIEYKLGFAANPDCRIIDWRKAPISKLYYEYKEGEEYTEEILGKERIGVVKKRNQIEIENSILKSVNNRHGNFYWDPNKQEWISKGGARSARAASGQLPEILSLISAQQFRSITEDATTAVLIQGVAGSGKTTVAIHRLAWMLHEDNSSITSNETAFIVLSPSLRAYIQNSLPAVGIQDVKVHTYHEWAARTIKFASGASDFVLARPINPAPAGIDRVKKSMALLKAVEAFVSKQEDKHFRTTLAHLQGDLLAIFKMPQVIIDHDETRLITAPLIQETFDRSRRNFSESLFDWADDALLLHLYQLKVGSVINEELRPGKYRHLFVDEVQDFSPVELATVISAVKKASDVTLVGDISQNLDSNQSFPGWEKLQKHWNLHSEISKYISLSVSYRSTAQIMKLAAFIQGQGESSVTAGRQGRPPIWFLCKHEEDAIGASIKWLKKAVEYYPNALTAVICATQKEAKFLVKMLTPTFGPLVRLGDAHSFSFEEGILVTDIKQVKGLEFFSVLLWNPNKESFPNTQLGKNFLYVAVTRAEENLSIVSWGRQTELLPRFGKNKLIRSMDLTIEDEEESDES
jgi:DNA helicase-2/ATP-dependent DNA helicase PcrA